MRTPLASLGAIAAAFAFAGAAHAQTLSYAGLDLSQGADAAAFSKKLDAAAKSYCAGEPVYDSHTRSRCEATARESMMASLPAAKRAAFEQALKGASTTQAATQATAPSGS